MAEQTLTKGPNFNPTPKDRFRAFPQAATMHHALLEADALQRALDHAELECTRLWSLQIKETAHAMAAGYKMQGLREFITIFKMLAEEPFIPYQPTPDNLSHTK